ncbi:hypothetical protein GE061_012158 [Apolygus lucorum]|uniref:Uncharacterized protein n=1 Tax=Apolygus lucorum TaxID=248454 RepID=A0A8S9XVL2_APOLU|nr:hypothetical protein GE061_012158 [Apolygus lucorum]
MGAVIVAFCAIVMLASCGASPLPEPPSSTTSRTGTPMAKEIDEEITDKPENIGDGFRKSPHSTLKSVSPGVDHSSTTASHTQFKNSAVQEHTTYKNLADVEHGEKKNSAVSELTTKKNVAGLEHTTIKNSAALQHTTNKNPAGLEHTTIKNSAALQHTTNKNPAGLEHTTIKNSTALQHTTIKNPPVMDHTTHRSSPSKQPTQNFHVKHHKNCSRKKGDHVFKVHVGTGQVVFFSGVCGPKSCVIKKELINDEL